MTADEWGLDEDDYVCDDPDCTCHDLDDLLLVEPWTTLTPNPRYL